MNPTLISSKIPLRVQKIGDSKIYLDPRISANQLAQYMVADHSRKETIIRDAIIASRVRVVNYQPARLAVPKCYDGNGLNAEMLLVEATRMETTSFPDQFEDDCNKLSAGALKKLAAIVHKLDCAGIRIPHSDNGSDNLMLENVRVSVQPEFVFSTVHRGVTKYGGVIITFSKGEYTSLARASGKYRAGDYAAFLLFLMLSLRYGQEGGPRYSSCIAVDVYRDEVYAAPKSQVTLLKNVQAACRTVALQWQSMKDEEIASVELRENGEDFSPLF